MPTETLQIFHGDGHAKENPADFLKSFNHAMRQQSITVSTDKLDAFGDYLGTSSQAEVWFKGLSSANKTSWPTFVAAFETRWPPIVIAEKTKAEYEKELLEHQLLEAAIGTKTILYDRECWAHEAWATKVMQLATSAGIAASTSMIWQVRGLLPSIVKDLLKDDEYMDWAAFIKEVKELKGTRLAEKKEQHTKQEQEVNMLHADIARLQQRNPAQNSISALQNQLSRMSINSQTLSNIPQTNSTPNFSHQPTTAPQPFTITDEVKNSIRQLITSLPHYPDNPAGHAAYNTQISQWNAKWGEGTRVSHETGYPLKPGTAAIASSECFACGTHGHNGRNCTLPVNHVERLSRKEAVWRAIVSKVLGTFNRATAMPISLVLNQFTQPASAWIEEVVEFSEGKEEGSA
ncbi:hypothetical protein BDR06DRAFT_892644 [Suillus hirtellus]|nr:hypothetical protein BDR06DRAFT_892644 [Suillus hirtellus]